MPSYHHPFLAIHISQNHRTLVAMAVVHTHTHVVGVRYPMEYKLGNQIAKEWTDREVAVTDINVQQTTSLAKSQSFFLAIIVDHLIKLV